MRITEKLSTCPFCGSSAHKGFSVIFCDGCEAKMESQHGEAACVEQWNRRVTPVEIGADVVEVACRAWERRNGRDPDALLDMVPNWKYKASDMQAALAATFPVLTQQVEELQQRLRDVGQEHFDFMADLSAANARLAKDAERYGTLRSSKVKQSQYSNFFQSVNDDCNPPYLELKHGADLDAAVDAVTAQVKKAELI